MTHASLIRAVYAADVECWKPSIFIGSFRPTHNWSPKMLFYRDDGEVIQDARIAFNTNPGDVTQIRQIAIVEGSSTDLRTYPIANYIIEVEQPFWISGCDHVYLNPEFAYGTDMIEWIRGLAAGRSDVPIQFSMAHLDSLEGAIELSRTEVGRYTSGRPIWRRGALSCTPNQGGPRSTLSATLSDAIHAQLVVAELVSKVAMQLVRKQKGSRFFGKKNRRLHSAGGKCPEPSTRLLPGHDQRS